MMRRQINIALPEETMQLIEQTMPQIELDSLINDAVKNYIAQKTSLREELKEGAIRRGERDLNLAREWFDLEEEIWQKTNN
jgi:CopG family transcriptional regulator/antitoxin EndoAI